MAIGVECTFFSYLLLSQVEKKMRRNWKRRTNRKTQKGEEKEINVFIYQLISQSIERCQYQGRIYKFEWKNEDILKQKKVKKIYRQIEIQADSHINRQIDMRINR
ncbi:hypothetical protein TTHERM_000263119 (macronuclear) [Tetrahymena thermophila SB210]|uniref:Uncharacterized protein n=1 Tax=Tetrahymena thermophila (strain SB210) TaxID=312017 RepID=W7XGI2_TETTS|nr:hypothetical protein TTHERM_000263119 [Tetrahymena thermophila SB210]EWS76108.1 hypothetical protein TTHERM_000263119 [Tetrahymena thermophila SB210]|eukprot:XP_012651348.1 hypothetical protein TTHERM_000263119 [Tetrahymena thermophila SB210]